MYSRGQKSETTRHHFHCELILKVSLINDNTSIKVLFVRKVCFRISFPTCRMLTLWHCWSKLGMRLITQLSLQIGPSTMWVDGLSLNFKTPLHSVCPPFSLMTLELAWYPTRYCETCWLMIWFWFSGHWESPSLLRITIWIPKRLFTIWILFLITSRFAVGEFQCGRRFLETSACVRNLQMYLIRGWRFGGEIDEDLMTPWNLTPGVKHMDTPGHS